jgi:hypothetical protein
VFLAVVIFNTISPHIVITGNPLTKANVLIADTTGQPGGVPESIFNELRVAGLSWVRYDSPTVDSMRGMSSGGYRIIILRIHSGPNAISTSEPYSLLSHAFEQVTDRVGKFHVEGRDYFAILPEFVRTMAGRFDGATILLMGCNSLAQSDMAKAFLEKGASAVIGWKGLIMPSDADLAILVLLGKLVIEQRPIMTAVAETRSILGPYLGPNENLAAYAN